MIRYIQDLIPKRYVGPIGRFIRFEVDHPGFENYEWQGTMSGIFEATVAIDSTSHRLPRRLQVCSPRITNEHGEANRQYKARSMFTPSLIYRYQAPTRQNIENIKNSVLWISHPRKFNDPFDCAEAMVFNRSNEVRANTFYDGFLNFNDLQMMQFVGGLVEEDSVADEPDSVSPSEFYLRQHLKPFRGITCFSEVPKHLLMWSHYADSHKGFCLEFATGFSPFCDQLHKVVYQNVLPTTVPSEREPGNLDCLRRFLLVKARVWSYEKEWRIVSEMSDTTIAYPRAAIKRILVGAKASVRTHNALKKAVASRPIEVVRLKLAIDKFRLEESLP